MKRRRAGKSVRLNKANLNQKESVEYDKVCHSFVVHRGAVSKSVLMLTKQTRDILRPYTATNLRVSRKNVMKDFFSVAGPLGVTHFCTFTATSKYVYMRVARFPRGPTLTFRLRDYVLTKDVRQSLSAKAQNACNNYAHLFQDHPLLILNNFSAVDKLSASNEKGEEALMDCDDTASVDEESRSEDLTVKAASTWGNPLTSDDLNLVATVFRHLLPSIDVSRVKLRTLRRCLLLNFDYEKQLFEMRHYAIRITPVGLSRPIKKIVCNKKIPNMSAYQSIADYVSETGYDTQISDASDSEWDEAENMPSNKVVLSQKVGQRIGNVKNERSAIKLVELGPRLNMELLKVEDGLHEGSILYHRLITKTSDQVAALDAKRKSREREKERRRKEQSANIQRKTEAREAQRRLQRVKADRQHGQAENAAQRAMSSNSASEFICSSFVADSSAEDMSHNDRQAKRRGDLATNPKRAKVDDGDDRTSGFSKRKQQTVVRGRVVRMSRRKQISNQGDKSGQKNGNR